MTDKNQNEERLLFVGADLSGIQDFLYNITSRKASVSLKGRSQYLVDYLKELLDRMLHLPEVTPYNGNGVKEGVVYDSGGKFYAVVQDTPSARQAIDIMSIEAEKRLWDGHRGQLAISMVYVPFTFASDGSIRMDSGKEENLGALWRESNKLFAQHKVQKFRDMMLSDFDKFFMPDNSTSDAKVCAVTGIESDDCVSLDTREDAAPVYVLPSVRMQIERGMAMQREEHFKSFEDYAQGSYLGVLRMDVDGLGTLFAEGFKTFGEYARFSTTLGTFFGSRLKEIQQRPEFRDYLNVVYAGGDDLFVVGRWDKTIDFAHMVHDVFVQYVGREGVTISGGVAVVDAKFPIAKAAELAGEAERQAKHFRDGEKNAFCMLGQCLSWKGEFEETKRLSDKMFDLCSKEEGKLPRSILHRLVVLNRMRQDGDPSALWNTAYYIARFRKDSRCKSRDVAQFLDNIERYLLHLDDSRRHYALAALAARWAELRLRTENNKNK